MHLYFAYGSNMNATQMGKRCPTARFITTAVLKDHRLTYPLRSQLWTGGVAGFESAPGCVLEGVVWELSDEELAVMDEFEDVGGGQYRRERIAVFTTSGEVLSPWTYIACPEDGGPFAPSAEYLTIMVDGAVAHGLTYGYIKGLRDSGNPPRHV